MIKPVKLTDHSLYRYAGGKNRVKKEIINHIFQVNPSLKKLVSPFFGGGCIEMLMASMGVEVKGYDFYRPLADFWEVLQEPDGPQRLYDELIKHYPLNTEPREGLKTIEKAEKDLYKRINSDNYKSYLPLMKSDDKFTRAWAFYVCIKGSYSGKIGCSTFLSRAEYRTVGLEKVRDYYNPNLSFEWGDCFDVIPQHNEDFLYLDPPYFDTVSYYYGCDGEHHKGFDHQRLAEILREHKGGFAMSYDNTPAVKKLYKDFASFRIIQNTYQMSGTKRFAKKELLIVKPSEVDWVKWENERFRFVQKALAL